MDVATGQDHQALLAELARARDRLDALVGDLRSVDDELDGLETERRQHRLLRDACGALEELGEIGGAELFWGDRAATGAGDAQIRSVRTRVDVFEKQVSEIEDRRQALLEEVLQQHDVAGLLADEVFEAHEEEERRKQEWIVEREGSSLPARALAMPWMRGGEDDQRFRKSLATSLLSSLLFALVVTHIEIPLRGPDEEPVAVPERVVRLMMQARPLPPAPPARIETKSEPPKQLAEQKPQENPKQSAKPSTEGPGKGTGEGGGEGPGKGLLAFREKLAGFEETQLVARLGSHARLDDSGNAANGRAERSMITTQAPGSSGGINLAALSRDIGGGGKGRGGSPEIAGVQIARATSTIGGGGGATGSTESGRGSGGPPLGRTDEEIQIVFDRHKAALYRLYNRELRNDPTLQGQMILHLRIEPDGSVSLCELQATDMKAPELVAQVLDRVRSFDFGAKEGIAAVTILYPIDFLPAT